MLMLSSFSAIARDAAAPIRPAAVSRRSMALQVRLRCGVPMHNAALCTSGHLCTAKPVSIVWPSGLRHRYLPLGIEPIDLLCIFSDHVDDGNT
ncbi:hypothetical protein C8R47DRAFT_1158935 [Mycena vitilis]|nr:hypothetical protein C8R47DRAFT_1158935 [Mycena vitilis]